ncbi:MAG: DUF4424 family protein, partial [Hyphomicrobiaceae bacterium]
MTHRSLAFLALPLLSIALAWQPVPVAAAEISTEVGAGGLSFAANPSIKIEQQDVLITPDRITVTYTLRNEANSQQSIYVSFALPDLDANAVIEGEVALAAADSINFVQFATTADGQPITVLTEQRATALGLDVTNLLSVSGIPQMPTADGLPARLEALTEAQR